MDSRFFILFLRATVVVLVVVMLSGCWGRKSVEMVGDEAESVIQPEVERRKIKPPKIDNDNFELTAFYGLMSVEDFETSGVFGGRLAYHVSEGFFVEGTYGTTTVGETSFEKLSGGAPILTDDQRKLTYYDLSIGWNLLPGEVFIGRKRAFPSALYVIAGAGNTSFADDDFFTLVFGAGYRMLLTDWLAFRFDARDRLWDSDLLGTSKTTHNFEFELGFSVFF
ncbi:MAG: outer membrane beta-barrel domain-containing protein [Gammaproteobacteria bacterium]